MKAKFYQIILTVLLSSLIIGISWAQCPININDFNKTDACFAQNDGTAMVSVSGGTDPSYYYELVRFNGSGFEFIDDAFIASSTHTFTNIPPANNYRINILNGSCTVVSTSYFNINELTEIIIDATLISVTGNTKCTTPFDGAIDVTGAVSGGTGTYEYSIDGGATYQAGTVFSNLEHGTYTVRVRDSNGCIKEASNIVVADNRLIPTATITPDPAAVCVGNDLNLNGNPLSGTAPYTHTWTGDIGPLSATNIPNPVFNSAASGTFNLTYTVTDANGCSASDNITVTVNEEDATFTYVKYEFCQSEANPVPQSITTAGGSFTSSDAANLVVDGTTGEINLSASVPGTYNVTYTTAGSCPASSSRSVTIYAVPTANDQNPVLCEDSPGSGGATVDLTALHAAIDGGAGHAITWYEDAALTTLVADPTTVTVSNADDFFARVDDGTCQNSATVIYTVNAAPTANDQNPVLCEDSPGSGVATVDLTALHAAIDGGAGHAITWYEDAALTTLVADPTTVTVSNADDFFARVDDGTCQNTATVIYTEHPLPVVYNIEPAPELLLCSGQDAVVGLDGSELGVDYTLLRNGIATAVTVAGTGSAINLTLTNGSFASGDVLTVEAVNVTTTCTQMMNGVSTIKISDPVVFDLTPVPTVEVCNGEDVTVSLSGSEVGMSYILRRNGVDEQTVAGTGAALNFTLLSGTFNDADVLTVVADNSVCQVSMNGSTTIDFNGKDASFSYGTGTFCNDGANPLPQSVTTPGGEFSTNDPANLSIDPVSGEIDLAASTVGGPYTIFYTLTEGSCVSQTSVQVTITDAPDATFSYDLSSYCQGGANPVPTPAPGASFGTFSATPQGLVFVDVATGEVDLAASIPGTYSVTNFIAASGSCDADSHSEFIEIVAQEDASFSYASTAYCQSEANPVATVTGTAGGTFTAAAGLVFVSTSTGEIDLLGSTPGTYTITYTTAGTCADSQTFDITINPADDASFSYAQAGYCKSEANPVPVVSGLAGGTFSSEPGLAINSSTGEIDLASAASMPGDYVITYTTNGTCPASSTFNITIYEVPVANAGTDGSSCTLEYTLGATPPTVGTGVWTVVTYPSGTATASFDSASSNDATVNVNEAGTYRFRWEVANGSCTDAKEIDITFTEPISIVQQAGDPGKCDPSSPWGYINIKVSGGSGTTYDILWSNGEGITGGDGWSGGEDLDGDTPSNPTAGVPSGVYTVEVADNGTACKTTGIFLVRSSDLADSLSLTGSSVSCNGSLGQINLEYNGLATGPYDIYYINSKADTIMTATKTNFGTGLNTITDVATDLPADLYYIHVNDIGGGCSVADTIRISEPDPILFSFPADFVDHVTCHDGSDGAIRIDVSGGTPKAGGPPDYDYQWYKDGVEAGVTVEDPTNLAAGDYYLKVTDGNGCTATSTVITITQPAPDPAPVASAASAVGCTEFTANWSDEAVTGYVLDVATDISFDQAFMHPDYNSITVNGTSQLVNTNITVGTTYYYRVRAVKSCGLTESSNVIMVTTEDVSSTVTKAATSVFCDVFTANWEEIATATQYLVEVAEDADFTSMVAGYAPATVPAGTDNLNVTGLTMGQQYFYRIQVDNACGVSAYSDTASVNLLDVPAQPTGLAGSNPTCDGFDLSWNVVPGAGSYTVEVDDDAAFASIDFQTVVNTENVTVNGLALGSYFYRIIATNGCGDGSAATGSYNTQNVPVVPNITALVPSCDGFELTWDVISNADEYVVEITNPTTNITWSDTVIVNTFVADTLAVNTAYEVRVRAQNACGDGSFSATQTMSTLPEEQCGCGHEKATFVVDPVNANCVGSEDGALMVNLLPVPGESVAPDRFDYSMDAVNWEKGMNMFGLVHAFTDLRAGEYKIYIRDNNAQDGCKEVLMLERTISVQNKITVTTKAESCTGSDGAITLNVPGSCTASINYYFIWKNGDTNETLNYSGTEAEGLMAGNYQIIIQDADFGYEFDTLNISLANNCSSNGGSEPSAICDLGDKTVDLVTENVRCDTGEGSVTFTVRGGENIQYSFRVFNDAGSVNETQEAVGSATFNNLPADSYNYVVIDASGNPKCQASFDIKESMVVISSVNYTLPQCDAVEQVAELSVTLSVATTAPAPYDVYAIYVGDTLSRGAIEAGTNSAVLTGLPTGATYEVVVKSRAAGTCPAVRQVEVPQTGQVAISFDIAPVSITCYGEGGSVTINNLVVAKDAAFTVNLYKVDHNAPYASRVLQIAPSSYTFTDLEKGEYQIQVVQQQTSCGTLVSTASSPNFIIEGPDRELQAEIPDVVRVSANDPKGSILIGDIRGGGLPYSVRIAADPHGASTPWQEVINNNPAINDYEHTFTNLERGIYFVQVQDQYGCTLTQTVEIQYTEDVYIPNIFTPNGDGENDTFRIINLPLSNDENGVKMMITNRWGRVIYQSNNYTNHKAWDGDDNPDGIYFYRLTLPNETGAYSGWVEVWRGRTP